MNRLRNEKDEERVLRALRMSYDWSHGKQGIGTDEINLLFDVIAYLQSQRETLSPVAGP